MNLQDVSHPSSTLMKLKFADGVTISFYGAEVEMFKDPSRLTTVYEIKVPGPCPEKPHHRDERTNNHIHVNTIDYERSRIEEWERSYGYPGYKPDWTERVSARGLFHQEYQAQLYQMLVDRSSVLPLIKSIP